MNIRELTELVNAARKKDYTSFSEHFENLMQEKAQKAVDQKRVEVATSFFVPKGAQA